MAKRKQPTKREVADSFRRSASGCGSQGMHSPAHFYRRGGENHRIPERILYRE